MQEKINNIATLVQTKYYYMEERYTHNVIRQIEVMTLEVFCILINELKEVNTDLFTIETLFNHIADNFENYQDLIYLHSPSINPTNVIIFDEKNCKCVQNTGIGMELILLDSWAVQQLLQDLVGMTEYETEELLVNIFKQPRSMYD